MVASLPVTEKRTLSAKEIYTESSGNFLSTVQKADLAILCTELRCDVPPAGEHLSIKTLCIKNCVENDNSKVSNNYLHKTD